MSAPAAVIVQENTLSSRIKTIPMLDDNPPALRVQWISWDSSFRNSDLQVGDQIVAVNGKVISRPATTEETQKTLPLAIGQYAESQFWTNAGATEGDALEFRVRRRNIPGEGWRTLSFRGQLRAERSYYNVDGRPLLGDSGPYYLANDGFGSAWSSWYEETFLRRLSFVLDPWQQNSISSRVELQNHLEDKPRVDFLVEHYPGPFSSSVKADWEIGKAALDGRRYEINVADLEYRRAADERIQKISETARQAWNSFLKLREKTTIPPFPLPNVIHDDIGKLTGKYVVLPPVRYRDWVSQAGHNYLTATDGNGWYFADAESRPAMRMLAAVHRYRELVDPNIREDYAIAGRILPDPGLLVIDGRGVFGLKVEIAGALIGDAMFVDLTGGANDNPPFAGEETLLHSGASLPPDSATPRQIMETLFASLKAGDEQLWRALFASWYVSYLQDGRPVVYPYAPESGGFNWEDSRRRILERVYDLHVLWVDDVRVITTGKEFLGAPLIEEVNIEIDHVGFFNGEYRTFHDVTLNRLWQLQRLNGGPWRITSVHAI